MAWPGLALTIDQFHLVPPTTRSDPEAFSDGIRYLTGTESVVAGDDLLLSFYPGFEYEYADADSGAQATLAIEHASGPAAVRVSAGWDGTGEVTNPAEANVTLGTFNITGSGILTVPLPFFTLAQFLTYEESLVVRVEVLSGSAELRQIRLRVWPPSGPRGAWVTINAQTGQVGLGAPSALTFSPFSASGSEFHSMPSSAWDYAAAELPGSLDGSVVSAYGEDLNNGFFAIGTISIALTDLDPTYEGSWTRLLDGLLAFLNVENSAAVIMDDFAPARPPDVTDEQRWFVPSDDPTADSLRLVGEISTSGTHDPAGEPTYLTWAVADAEDVVGSPYPSNVGPLFVSTADTEGGISFDITVGIGSVTGNGRAVLLGAGNAFFSSPGAYDGPGVIGGLEVYHRGVGQFIQLSTLAVSLSVPSFQVWDPDALPDYPPMRQRQRRDGLGMGAPAIRVGGSRQGSTRIRGHY